MDCTESTANAVFARMKAPSLAASIRFGESPRFGFWVKIRGCVPVGAYRLGFGNSLWSSAR